jgi:hypothetical protein
MAKISNDQELRAALAGLSADRQRVIGAQFVKNVIALNSDDRVARAVETALNIESSPEELDDAYRVAKGHATRTYTDCGKDTDWLAQADHFVAAATAAALTQEPDEHRNRAWKAAVQARMAVNCAQMEDEDGELQDEAGHQYRIAEAYLG